MSKVTEIGKCDMSDKDDLYKDIIQNDPRLRDLPTKMAESMTRSIEKNIDQEMEQLFGSLTTMVPEQKSNLTIEELMKTAQLFESPKLAWRRDREACLIEDMKEGRGKLVLNPDYEGAELLNGDILEKNGKEYRALADEAMKDMVNSKGEQVLGYWVDPLPPLPPLIDLKVEVEDNRTWDDMAMRVRCYGPLGYPPINHTIQGLGVGVVDLGPVPLDMVAAELPRATVRQQERALKQRWRTIGRPISLKAYARQSKWGRAWLERKRR